MLTALALVVLACLLWPPPARRGWALGTGRSGRRDESPAAGWGWAQGRPAGVMGRLRRRGRRPDDDWVADFAEVVAVGLQAGLDLPSATVASARSPGVRRRAPWLAERLQGSVRGGGGVTALLDGGPALADEEQRDLRLLVTAWRLAEQVGAGASAVTTSAAASVRERRAAADRTAVVVAGPRASMVLLSALPLAGPVAAALVGLPPGRLYDSTAARVLAAAGLVLTGAGWWWARSLLRRARRPGRTDEEVR